MVKPLTKQVNSPEEAHPEGRQNEAQMRPGLVKMCQLSGSPLGDYAINAMASILLVDDDFDGTEALAHTLRRGGHEVRHVENGRDALSAILERLPQLVILDLKMPEMSGIDLLEIMRSYLRLSDVPVIVFTAYPDRAIEGRGDRLKVLEIFEKGKSGFGELLDWINPRFPPASPPAPVSPVAS
jgi:CheY-like chemotaxis protein